MISPRGWRLIASAAVVAAGGWAARQLDFRYTPPGGAPEIEVAVAVDDAAGSAAIARTWFLPVEAAARSLPGFAGMAGEVAAGGGWLRIRFAPGADAESLARLLAADLRQLRNRLAGQGSLDIRVTGAAASDLVTVIALRGPASAAAAPRLLAALESCPTIRKVELLGGWRDETVIRLRPAAAALLPQVATVVRGWQGVRRLGILRAAAAGEAAASRGPGAAISPGDAAASPGPGAARSPGDTAAYGGFGAPGERRAFEGAAGDSAPPGLPVTAGAGNGPLPDLAIPTPAGPLRLAALAEIASDAEPLPRQVHVQGRPARALVVTAAAGASPFELDRDLRRNLALLPAGATAETLLDDGADLRRMLLCLSLGALCAALILGAAGWQGGGMAGALDSLLALPVAAAAALLACRAGGVVLDLATLTAVAGGIAAALPSGIVGRRPGDILSGRPGGLLSHRPDRRRIGPPCGSVRDRPSYSVRHDPTDPVHSRPGGLPGHRPGGLPGHRPGGLPGHHPGDPGGLPGGHPGGLAGGFRSPAGGWQWQSSVPVTCALAAAGVPIALALSTSLVAPLLVRPAWAFCLALLAALAAMALLPRPESGQRPRGPRWLPRALRQADAVLLGGATAILVALVLWRGEIANLAGVAGGGGGTTPASGANGTTVTTAANGPNGANATPESAAAAPYLSVDLALPQGASLDEAEREVAAIEGTLGTLEGVRGSWSELDARHAHITVQVKAAWRGRGRLQLLVERLRLNLPAAADAALTLGAGFDQAHAAPASSDLEDLPAADDTGRAYRCLLRSTSLDLLQQGYSRLVATLLAHQVKRERLHPGWGPPTLHEELAPRPGMLPQDVAAVAAALRARTLPAARLPFPGRPRQALIVLTHGADLDPWRAPQRAELLDQALPTAAAGAPAAAVLTTRRWMDPGRVLRQSGRFVLPVDIDFPSDSEGARKLQRETIDRALGEAPLPPGVELDRPALSAFRRAMTNLAEASPAGFLLLLWLGLAVVRLGSPGAALAALIPLAAGLAAAAGGLWVAASLSPAPFTPLGLVLLIAGLAAGFPLAIDMAATAAAGAGAAPGSRAAALRRYAWREPRAVWAGLAAAALLVVSALAAALGGGDSQVPWTLPLWLAAAAAGAALAAAIYLVPSLITAVAAAAGAGWRRRTAETRLAAARPAAWEAAGSPRLAVRNLTKVYRNGVVALGAVTFELQPGVIGLLGPNGAGKTTLLRLLVGILDPSRGSVFFRGLRVSAQNGEAYRRRLGFLPQELNAYPGSTARHYLEHWADARGLPRGARRDREIGELLARVGLLEHEDRKARDFSGGMLRRLGIAAALLGSPPLLIVDEPTAGLDFAARADFRELLLAAVAPAAAPNAAPGDSGESRRIVLLSTHIASDVEAVASKLLVLDRGRLRYDGSVAGLVAAAQGKVFSALVEDARIAAVSARYRLTSRIRTLDGVQVRGIAAPGQEPLGPAVEPTLEEAYLALLTPAADRSA